MEITYNFADGENVIVLVDEKLGSTIMQLSKDLTIITKKHDGIKV